MRNAARIASKIAAALIICAAVLMGCEQKPSKPVVTDSGEFDFTLNDVSGKPVTLSSYRGKVVLLEFWATWCPPCRESVPELKELHSRLNGRDFALVAVAIKDTDAAVKKFVSEEKIPYQVLIDDIGVHEELRVFNIPTAMLLDRQGRLVTKYKGYAPGAVKKIEEDIMKTLKEDTN